MADYDNRVLRGQTAVAGAIDAGLRAHMLRVYNYMLIGLALTGATAWLPAEPSFGELFYRVNPVTHAMGLTLLGMTRHWWFERKVSSVWKRNFLLQLVGLVLCGSILVVTIYEKFGEVVFLVRSGVEVSDGCDAHQKGTSVARRPVPGRREPTTQQKSRASVSMASPPVPTCHLPPAAPVSVSVNGWSCRRAHSATTSAIRRPSWSAVSTMGRPIARLMSRRCIQVSRVKMVSTR